MVHLHVVGEGTAWFNLQVEMFNSDKNIYINCRIPNIVLKKKNVLLLICCSVLIRANSVHILSSHVGLLTLKAKLIKWKVIAFKFSRVTEKSLALISDYKK